MCFLSNFGCKIIFLCSVNFCALSIFGISKIPTHCWKEALVTWLLSASGVLQMDPLIQKKKKERIIYSQACLFQDSLIHFWCAVLECKIPCCFFKKRFSFSCSLLDALETFGTNHSYYYPIVVAGVIWGKSWNWNLYMNRWCLPNCVDLIDRASTIKSVSNIS